MPTTSMPDRESRSPLLNGRISADRQGPGMREEIARRVERLAANLDSAEPS
jgi:hypothetical protein